MAGDLAVIDLAPPPDDYAQALLEGFAGPQRRIPCRFLYDDEGSRLFERITELPEYYPTRTEMGLLSAHAREIAKLAGPKVEVVELGAGASRKVRLLLDALEAPAGYLGIDVARTALTEACTALARDYKSMKVRALVADFTDVDRLPPPNGWRLAFFPGSTIGNFPPEQAAGLLDRWRRLLAGSDMVIGVDLQKDPSVLLPAYDDAAGVTAAFNLNLLARANREAGADFDLAGFRHVVHYEPALGRMSLYLESLRDQQVAIAGRPFRLDAGERIHTEDSWKYTLDGFRDLVTRAGFEHLRAWTDDRLRFSLHYLRGRL
ncbi:L-histidine N(alpha)-methyltransferase [Desertibaculum subflavum]|uniref:L-histidine N(alpha)-methyltransferase n=1 Tax=Desertibaculum subflavum TaxID=2268458 RepID=UPI000E6764E6